MNQKQKDAIVVIGKEFAEGLMGGESINGTGWVMVDPLAGYLGSIGFTNKVHQVPANNNHPQVLIIEFTDGTQLIPTGADLKPVIEQSENWMWV